MTFPDLATLVRAHSLLREACDDILLATVEPRPESRLRDAIGEVEKALALLRQCCVGAGNG